MTRKATLMCALLLCISAHANAELAFTDHGFSIELAEGWAISETSALYEQYISTNEKAFGEEAANQLSRNTSIIFKANKENLNDAAALYTCIIARNIPDLPNMTEAETTRLIEEMAGNSYRTLALRGLDVTKPVLQSADGIKSSTHRLTQEEGEHITEYKLFIAGGNAVICVGGALSTHSDDIVFMNDSIKTLRGVKP